MVGEVRFAAARNFSKFDGMRTEELKELLHQDSMMIEEEADVEIILYITQLLAVREKEELAKEFDAETSWLKFKKEYYPKQSEDETEIIVYNSKGVDHYISHNIIKLSAAWHTDDFEWTVVGNAAVDEIKRTIDLIYR